MEQTVDRKKIGLYLHIPFCRERCNYCSFYSVLYDENLLTVFLEAFILEINLRSFEIEKSVVDSIFIGGGTPSLLSCKNIKTGYHLQSICRH